MPRIAQRKLKTTLDVIRHVDALTHMAASSLGMHRFLFFLTSDSPHLALLIFLPVFYFTVLRHRAHFTISRSRSANTMCLCRNFQVFKRFFRECLDGCECPKNDSWIAKGMVCEICDRPTSVYLVLFVCASTDRFVATTKTSSATTFSEYLTRYWICGH